MALIKYEVLVVDPETERRNRLKQSLIAAGGFNDLLQLAAKDEMLHKLKFLNRTDIAFISFDLGVSSFSELVKASRQSKDADSCFVVILQESQKTETSISSFTAVGADGFLLEPFSVDAVREISTVASNLRAERRAARELASYQVLANKMIEHVNAITMLKRLGSPTILASRALKDSCKVLETLEPDALARAHDVIASVFESAPCPPDIMKELEYAGPSKFVRKRLAERLLAKMKDSGAIPK